MAVIRRRLDAWPQTCMYDCVVVDHVECIDNRCEAIHADFDTAD